MKLDPSRRVKPPFSSICQQPTSVGSISQVGVLVGVDVGVFVGVNVGVLVGVSVGVAVGPSVGVEVGVFVGTKIMLNGDPATHNGPLVKVPSTAGAVESKIIVPLPSFMPQRPMSPVPLVNSELIAFWISVCVRATFQIRASSRTPLKKPCAVVPLDRIEDAKAVGEVVADAVG